MREDDGGRDRSPLRTEERCDTDDCDQLDAKKQKLTFGFGKKTSGNEQKKGIQIKLGSASVSKIFVLSLYTFFPQYKDLFFACYLALT